MLIGSACGSSGDDGPAAPESASEDGRAGPADIEPFLLREGEEPGFRPGGEASTIVGVDAIAEYWELPPADARRLRERGFISFTRREIDGGETAAGVSEVLLYLTPEGARDQMTYDLRTSTIHAALPDTTIRRFAAGEVPGARGWTGSDVHGNPIGILKWVQGRCLLVLANEGDVPFVKALSTGARAIYERTGGDCP